MGSSYSNSYDSKSNKDYYREVTGAGEEVRVTGSFLHNDISGGGINKYNYMVGGVEDIITNNNKLKNSSNAKRDLIIKLSNGVSKVLKTNPLPSNSSNMELINHMLTIVPNPKKGKTIINDKKKQMQICIPIYLLNLLQL